MSRSREASRLATVLTWLHRGEDLVLSILLLLTLGLAFGQIILRNLLGTSIVWADILVRILVLWLGLLGAMIATREKKHISIDLISRYLSPAWQLAADWVMSIFSCAVCMVAGYFSLLFVIDEYQAGEIAFARIPAWLCEAILPAAFMIIAARYAIQSAVAFVQWRKAVRP